MYRMSGTPGTIIGRVVANNSSSNTAKPISGATVTLLSEDKLAAVTTDANGFFTVTGLVQLDDLRLSAVAPGFLTYYTSTFNIDPTSSCTLPTGMLANPCLDYQSGYGDLALQAETVITGVVTDATTLLPIAGVNVTLVSPDALPAATTTAAGVYSFSVYDPESTNTTPWSLIFSDAAYSSSVITVSNLGNCTQVQLPSGATQPTCYYNVALTRTQGTLAGTVRFDAAPAAGATIFACSSNGEGLTSSCSGANFLGQQTLPANGQFSFAVQLGQSYTLNVLPWDSNNDGVTDTQFFSANYGPITGEGSTNYTNIAINLQAPSKTVIASSFVNGIPAQSATRSPSGRARAALATWSSRTRRRSSSSSARRWIRR